MNFEDAKQYWNTVSKPALQEEIDKLQVGDTAWLEDTYFGQGNRIVIVTKRELDDNGHVRLTFRNAYPHEIDGSTPSLVIVAGGKKK